MRSVVDVYFRRWIKCLWAIPGQITNRGLTDNNNNGSCDLQNNLEQQPSDGQSHTRLSTSPGYVEQPMKLSCSQLHSERPLLGLSMQVDSPHQFLHSSSLLANRTNFLLNFLNFPLNFSGQNLLIIKSIRRKSIRIKSIRILPDESWHQVHESNEYCFAMFYLSS